MSVQNWVIALIVLAIIFIVLVMSGIFPDLSSMFFQIVYQPALPSGAGMGGGG